MNKPILFVHIPKTAGTSVNQMLANRYSWNVPAGYLSNHQPVFVLEKHNNLSDYFVFTVVRNPFTRAYSYYRHYQRIHQRKLLFNDFLIDIQLRKKSVGDLKHLDLIPTDTKTPFISFTQSFYLFDSQGQIKVDKIYQQEDLSQLEQDFNVQLPRLNAGKYTAQQYYEAYNAETIDRVCQIYEEDFVNFGYKQSLE